MKAGVNKWNIRGLVEKIRPAYEGWMEEANCRGENTEKFIYPSEVPGKKLRKELTKICEGCPVLITCRKEALRLMEQGWWGGMDERERMVWAKRTLFKD